MTKMNAVICTKYGDPEVLQLQQVAKPVPQANELLIKIHATTATAASLAGRTGEPKFFRLFSGIRQPQKPILGQEVAGVVEAVGENVTRFHVGDQLFGMTGFDFGAYAEYTCMSEDSGLALKPSNMTYEEAAAIVEGGLTALNFLKHQANIRPGQKILIYGASGSVGTASVQIAKQFGAEVTGVCSDANVEMVKSLGADAVIDYTQQDFTKNGKTYDIIFDTVGKRSFSQCRGSLSKTGIYLDAAGIATVLPMMWTSLFSSQKAILAATYVRSAQKVADDLMLLKQIAEAGSIRTVIDKRYPLAQTAEAHRYVETGRKKGSAVINIVSDS